MNSFIYSAVLLALLAGGMSSAFAANVPCEDMLKELRDAQATATATVDAATEDKIAALEAKGVERCNADDDKRADAFFAEAMELLGK